MLLSIVRCDSYPSNKKQTPCIEQHSHSVEYVGPVTGSSAAVMRNRGAAASSGQWLFFVDSDVEFDEVRWLEFVKTLDSSNARGVVFGGRYSNTSSRTVDRAYHFIQQAWVTRGVDPKTRQAHHLFGGALLCHRDLFHRVGPFSETIGFGGEETEWLSRAHKQGVRLVFLPELEVGHIKFISLVTFFKRAWVQNWNRGFFRFEVSQERGSLLSYFKAPWPLQPYLMSFFLVAGLGFVSGRLKRWAGGL